MQHTIIKLLGLKTTGYHGVYEYERREGQEFIVDAELKIKTPEDDDLTQTVDYGQIARKLLAVVEGEPVDLIETLAKKLLDQIMADPKVLAANVTVHKPNAPMKLEFDDVQVSVGAQR